MPISEIVKKGIQRDAFLAKLARDKAILALRYGSHKVYDLTGEYAEVEPPEQFNRELKNILAEPRPGLHRYMENAGYIDTRTAVANYLKAETGLNFSLAEVIMTSGASGAINMAIKAVLNPNEEVILFAPYGYDYEAYVTNHGGVARIVPFTADFVPDLAVLEAALTPKTKVIIINSPNNPAGIVYSPEILKKIANLILQRSQAFGTRIYIISDDSYRKYYYGTTPCPWILNYYPHTIIVGSYSKELSIPAERIGFTAISPLCEESRVVVGGLIHANRTLGFVNAPALMQNVVRNLQGLLPDIASCRVKRDFIYSRLVQAGYSAVKPEGAYFLLVKSPIMEDTTFVSELAKVRVLTLPGSLFGAPGYFRISYCTGKEVLEGALPGLQKALAKYPK
ncbi:MAG TPA: pyridoxal phosphate-dependent aminotransferase [Dehalococcoidales bacterium]|nr:pyridoxal phosphate-dependent aminotransferase [Dehalococcoidales bacterium]